MKSPGFTILFIYFFTVVAAKVTSVKSSWLSYTAQWAKPKNPETSCPDRGVMYKIEHE